MEYAKKNYKLFISPEDVCLFLDKLHRDNINMSFVKVCRDKDGYIVFYPESAE